MDLVEIESIDPTYRNGCGGIDRARLRIKIGAKVLVAILTGVELIPIARAILAVGQFRH